MRCGAGSCLATSSGGSERAPPPTQVCPENPPPEGKGSDASSLGTSGSLHPSPSGGLGYYVSQFWKEVSYRRSLPTPPKLGPLGPDPRFSVPRRVDHRWGLLGAGLAGTCRSPFARCSTECFCPAWRLLLVPYRVDLARQCRVKGSRVMQRAVGQQENSVRAGTTFCTESRACCPCLTFARADPNHPGAAKAR